MIAQSNARTWQAICAVRIDRNPATMGELRDSLNWRRRARTATLTAEEREALTRAYLLSPAGH